MLFDKEKYDQLLKSINAKSRIKRFIELCIGCFLIAVAFNLFLSPNNLAPGGVGGIAIILRRIFGWDNSVIILLVNIILLVISYFTLGFSKTKNSVLGSLILPLFIKLTANISVYISIDLSHLILQAIFGGVIFGAGAGIIFKAGYTTGGTDIINQMMYKYLHMGFGTSTLIIDGLIALISGFLFGPTIMMYALVALYIISYMTDRVILGISDSKAFYIVTTKDEEMKEFILKYLNHGVTVFNAKGGFKESKQKVLLCVLPTKDYYKLKAGINEIDKDAFFVVTDSYEVFGGE